MFGDVFSLGSIYFQANTRWEINTLLPGFEGHDHPESLHQSLERLRRGNNIFRNPADATGASISDDDIWAASLGASGFLESFDLDVHFQITMMFLSLRKRDWNKEAWAKIRNEFKSVRIPTIYLYRFKSWDINSRMTDVVEWVRGMEHVRTNSIIANVHTRLRRGEKLPPKATYCNECEIV
ncbi:hypothetical protein F5Y03DRAFT_269424 [Xylaria venustula]|nr:hypothetical protein F5Y03DRAFT_269424 [Xylaria venustula]